MPLYFFEVVKDGIVHSDSEGTECGSDKLAQQEAVGLMLDLRRGVILRDGQTDLSVLVSRQGEHPFYKTSLSLSGAVLDAFS